MNDVLTRFVIQLSLVVLLVFYYWSEKKRNQGNLNLKDFLKILGLKLPEKNQDF